MRGRALTRVAVVVMAVLVGLGLATSLLLISRVGASKVKAAPLDSKPSASALTVMVNSPTANIDTSALTILSILDTDATYSVRLAPPTDSGSGAPGAMMIYTLALTNAGDVTESFALTPSVVGQPWATMVTPTLTALLPPSGTVPVTVTVTISPTALDGQQSIATLTARSVTSPTVSDSSMLTTTAVVPCIPVSGADFTWSPVSPTTTQTVTFTGTVGGGSPSMDYAWAWGDGTPAGTGNPAFHTFTLSDTYGVVMTATNACGLVTATHAITVSGPPITPIYGVLLAPPTDARSGAPGGTVIYKLILTNTGDIPDSFDLMRVVAGESWVTTVTPTRTNTLPPGGTTSVIATVYISPTATSGQQSFAIVTATSVMTAAASDSSVLTTTAAFQGYLPLVMRNYTPPLPSLTLVADPLVLMVSGTSILTATAFDVDGKPIAGMLVSFSTPIPLGSSALPPFEATTDANGQVTTTLHSTLAGLVRVRAKASNGASGSVAVYFRPAAFCAPQWIAGANTGPEPQEIALDLAGQRAFIAHANGLTAIDTTSFAVITEVVSSEAAQGVAYDPDRDRVWVTYMAVDRVTVLDGTTLAPLADVPAGDGPHSVAYNPTNGLVYVSNYWDWHVNVYDANTLAYVAGLTGFGEPAHLAVNPVTNKIYVANHVNNGLISVIRGDTHQVDRIGVPLIDAYGITVDSTRNLVYATSIQDARLAIIDGATDQLLGTMYIRRGDGRKVPLRSVAINPGVGSEGHLFLTTSSEDGGEDQLLLIPNGWPTLGTPVPLDIASHPLEGIAVDPIENRVWVTSAGSAQVSVAQDGTPLCSTPFLFNSRENNTFRIEVLLAP